ncbi:MAG: hypothetical protein ABR998_03530 [Gemmatimonadales bacterium]
MRNTVMVVALSSLLLAASNAAGQTPPNLLVHPTGMLMCRMTPSPSLRILDFFDRLDSTQTQRQIRLAVDSTDAPVFLQLWAPEREGSRRAEIVLVGFPRGAKAFRAEGDVDSMLTETDSTHYPKLEALSDSEVTVARALAAWLWDHRCMKHGAGPSGPPAPL